MCFSAPVSFGAAAALTAAGAATVAIARREWRLLPLALLPLFFGLQQLMEGFVWLSLDGTEWREVGLWARRLYLFIAVSFWPLWIPFAVCCSEKGKDPQRYFWLLVLTMAGLAWLLVTLFHLQITEVAPQISGDRIAYPDLADDFFSRYLYGLLTILPFFLSSRPLLWFFGVAILVTDIVAAIAFNFAYLSVWCFLAALLSITLIFILRHEIRRS